MQEVLKLQLKLHKLSCITRSYEFHYMIMSVLRTDHDTKSVSIARNDPPTWLHLEEKPFSPSFLHDQDCHPLTLFGARADYLLLILRDLHGGHSPGRLLPAPLIMLLARSPTVFMHLLNKWHWMMNWRWIRMCRAEVCSTMFWFRCRLESCGSEKQHPAQK